MLYSSSEEATLELGVRVASRLSWGQTLALYGDLGAGKTVFSRGIARGLGVTEAITSPTFTIVQEYRLPERHFLFHLDMYRIDNEEAALAFGIEDFLFAPDAVTVVEWPERIKGLLPEEETLFVSLEHKGEELRQITLPDTLEQVLLKDGLPEGIKPVVCAAL